MSIDGTYGRLSAHNRRIKDLKYKKKERKKNINSAIRYVSSSQANFKKFDYQTVEAIKAEIRIKAQIQKRKEKAFWVLLSLLGIILAIYVIFFIIR